MRITSVAHVIPGRLIENEHVLDRLASANADHLSGADLQRMQAKVRQFFASAGTRSRYKLGADEHGIDIAVDAAERALERADAGRDTIDFVLYVGVGRGWVEPAVANVLLHRLGLTAATGFDLLDACASWVRALQVAHGFLRSGTYRRGLIVNCECGFVTYEDWRLDRLDDLDYRMAEWTIGEAATATVVSADSDDDDWHFVFKNFGEYFDICLFPLPAVAERFIPGILDRRHVPMRLFSLSGELMKVATVKLAETFLGDERLRSTRYDVIFGHAASDKATTVLSRRLDIPEDVHFPTHERYGNTVSASIPLGMSLALDEGRLERGQKVLLMAAASGISIALASFTY